MVTEEQNRAAIVVYTTMETENEVELIAVGLRSYQVSAFSDQVSGTGSKRVQNPEVRDQKGKD